MTTIRQIALPVAEALAAPEQDLLKFADWTPGQEEQLRTWWKNRVDDGNLTVCYVQKAQWETQQRRRDRLFEIQQIAGRIIRTDLYLTGPPYPSPR